MQKACKQKPKVTQLGARSINRVTEISTAAPDSQIGTDMLQLLFLLASALA